MYGIIVLSAGYEYGLGLKSRTQLRPLSPMGDPNQSNSSEPCIVRFIGGQARTGLGFQFVHKPPGNRESLELVAHFNPAYSSHTVKPCRTRHSAERRQYKIDLHLAPQRGSGGGEYKHSAVTNVHALAGVVVAPTLGPAEQERQRYLKSSRISSLDGIIHIRTQSLFAGLPNISTTRAGHKRVIVHGRWGRGCARCEQSVRSR